MTERRLAALVLVIAAVVTAYVVARNRGVHGGPSTHVVSTRFDGLVVRATHPRVWLDPRRVVWLREKVEGKTKDEVLAIGGRSVAGLALAHVATGDPTLCKEAFEKRKTPGPLYHLALLYDWCHGTLSARERRELREVLVPEMDAMMKNGRLWRSFHNAGHTHAFTLTIVALALHGEHGAAEKALAFLRPELEDMMLTFDEVFPDGAWGEGADYARHASHHGLRTLLAWKSATGVDLLEGSKHLQNVAQYIFYAAKPDGLMWSGDDNDWPYVSGWERMALLMSASEYRDPHAQWFLNHCPWEKFALMERDKWADLLWQDPKLPEKPLDDLSLSRLFGGKGLVLARTGWGFDDKDGAWLGFTAGPYFGDHDHFDVNSFVVSRRGDLAIDSGRYDDDWDFVRKPEKVARSQFFNYYQRTIAHNTMLVHDPAEVFPEGFVNDGGQKHLLTRGKHRNVPEDYAQGVFPSDDGTATCDWTTNPGRWDRGKITAYEGTADYVFVRGDGTKAYAAEKVSSYVRDFLFVRPRLVVVFDRVVSTNASFQKTWLLHTIDEPKLADDGAWFEVADGEGRLFGVPLLPEKRRLEKVGGPGKEFLVAGVPLKGGPQSELHPSPLHFGERPGAWRIEEKPEAAATEDYFANVMLLTDRSSDERPAVEVTTNDATALAFTVKTPSESVTLRFAKGARPAVHLKVERNGKAGVDKELANEVVP